MVAKKKSSSVNKKVVFYFELFEDELNEFTIYLYENPPPFDNKEPFKEFYGIGGYEECLNFINQLKSAEVYVTKKQTVPLT